MPASSLSHGDADPKTDQPERGKKDSGEPGASHRSGDSTENPNQRGSEVLGA
jgi:hypothetical protein